VLKVKKIIIALFFTLATANVYAVDQISLFVGEIKIIEVGSIDRVAVGNGALLSTSMLDNGQLLLLAEKEGETTVHIWYTDGAESDLKVQILTMDSNRVVHELRTLLSELQGVEVKEVGQRIFLTGFVQCTAGAEECDEVETLNAIISAYPDALNLTRVVQQRPPMILPINKMVSMDVKITEFNTQKLTELGINWGTAIAGPTAGVAQTFVGNRTFNVTNPGVSFAGVLPTEFPSALGTFGIATEILSTINLLAQTGDAVVLAEPKLSSRSGGKAEFLVGGEIPVITSSLSGTNVEFKEFGIILKIEPVVDDENNVLATVMTEISTANFAQAVQGIPTFDTRKTSTDVSMNDGETLVLSGLLDRRLSENIDKFPLLGDIPILGALFRSTEWRNNMTEMVIFVTPTVYDAQSQFNQQRVQRRQDMIEMFEKKVDRGSLIID
jgi:pilus assembly protein CpaC